MNAITARLLTDILFFATGYATHFIWKDLFLESWFNAGK